MIFNEKNRHCGGRFPSIIKIMRRAGLPQPAVSLCLLCCFTCCLSNAIYTTKSHLKWWLLVLL
ncbi:hypothetical protein EVA_20836 [gut metagenome]|uniref:Uncharacterized protein n=1 Tax=gut metagenome TaxID=749906 RepID=J9F849_9ZZZZ